MTILVTGSAGFIGSHFVSDWVNSSNEKIISIDNLSRSTSLDFIKSFSNSQYHHFFEGDINDFLFLESLFTEHKPRAVVHFAADTHVDRSISSPESFFQSNIMGTFRLLEIIRLFNQENQAKCLLLHVSTDEVFGSFNHESLFSESSPYNPSNPYSASKAASDHLVKAWHKTFEIPFLMVHTCNNFGPRQHFEKLIPLIITSAFKNEILPIYGDGQYEREWLFVNDHCEALRLILDKGKVGETYNIGSGIFFKNIHLIEKICDVLDEIYPNRNKTSYREKIRFVNDRPGHDRAYKMNSTKIKNSLGWTAKHNFEEALYSTVEWYLKDFKSSFIL
jgi:dTDP-glucose 4,6-dehydratase